MVASKNKICQIEYRGQCKRKQVIVNIINSSYLQWERLQKIVFLYSMKDQWIQIFAFRPSYISIPQYWPWISCIYDVLAVYKLSCKISHIWETLLEIPRIYLCSYHFTLRQFFTHACSIYSLKLFKEGNFWEVDL